ncbi:hypothetical protein D3C73_1193040 [compost metagenome]
MKPTFAFPLNKYEKLIITIGITKCANISGVPKYIVLKFIEADPTVLSIERYIALFKIIIIYVIKAIKSTYVPIFLCFI